MSSLAAFGAIPGGSIYAAAKHALAGFGMSVAAELNPSWGIKIIVLAAGSMRPIPSSRRPTLLFGREIEGYEGNAAGQLRKMVTSLTVRASLSHIYIDNWY
jgi:short-subunit dehydrogenase